MTKSRSDPVIIHPRIAGFVQIGLMQFFSQQLRGLAHRRRIGSVFALDNVGLAPTVLFHPAMRNRNQDPSFFL